MLDAKVIQGIADYTKSLKPIYAKKNKYFDTRVFRLGMDGQDVAVKIVKAIDGCSDSLLYREHEFLQAVKHAGVIKYVGHGALDDYYMLITGWINGKTVYQDSSQMNVLCDAEKRRFVDACWEIVNQLQSHGVHHRDIWEKNIVVSDKHPVLIDFGWACWENEADKSTIQILPYQNDIESMRGFIQRNIQCQM